MSVELKAVATLDGKQFDSEINKIGNSVGKTSSQLSGIKDMIAGAFTVGAIKNFAKQMMATADGIRDSAEAVGVSLNSMVALHSVYTQSGMKVEQLEQSMGKLRNAQNDVIKGTKGTIDAIGKLNITQEQFVSLGADELLALIAKRYEEARGSAEAFGAVSDIFGAKLGPKMIEVLKIINTEGLAKLKENARSATEGINELATAHENLAKIGDKVFMTWASGFNFLSDLVKMDLALIRGESNALEILTRQKAKAVPGAKSGMSLEEIRAKDKAIMEQPVSDSTMNLKALQDRKADDEKKRAEKIDAIWQKSADKQEARRKKAAMEDYDNAAKLAEIQSGVGAGGGPNVQADALARIGGFIGGRNDATAAKIDRQIIIAERMVEYLKTIAQKQQRNLVESGSTLGD